MVVRCYSCMTRRIARWDAKAGDVGRQYKGAGVWGGMPREHQRRVAACVRRTVVQLQDCVQREPARQLRGTTARAHCARICGRRREGLRIPVRSSLNEVSDCAVDSFHRPRGETSENVQYIPAGEMQFSSQSKLLEGRPPQFTVPLDYSS